jgi:hypothetical protein
LELIFAIFKLCTNKNHSYKHNEQTNSQNIDNSECFKLDDLEQHSRKSCVRISGVPESVGENTADIVCDIAKKLNVNLVSNDISVSHRVPSASRTEVDLICFWFTACLAR